jgi:hypothetical protein
MKFLIDTNIFIPIESVKEEDIEPKTPQATTLTRKIRESGSQLYVHPAQRIDIENDSDKARRKIRLQKFNTYPLLSNPPQVKQNLKDKIGSPKQGSHDWVDNQLIAAVSLNAVDFLISEDKGVLDKAKELNLRKRIINIDEAIETVDNLFEKSITPLPAVSKIKAYQLDENDPIFEELRNNYPGFDQWLNKCKREHRVSFTITHGKYEGYSAVSILKNEDVTEFGYEGDIIKVCTFKVANTGIKLGELMLKAIFDYSANDEAQSDRPAHD